MLVCCYADDQQFTLSIELDATVVKAFTGRAAALLKLKKFPQALQVCKTRREGSRKVDCAVDHDARTFFAWHGRMQIKRSNSTRAVKSHTTVRDSLASSSRNSRPL